MLKEAFLCLKIQTSSNIIMVDMVDMQVILLMLDMVAMLHMLQWVTIKADIFHRVDQVVTEVKIWVDMVVNNSHITVDISIKFSNLSTQTNHKVVSQCHNMALPTVVDI